MSLFDKIKNTPRTAQCLLLDTSISMDDDDGAGRRIELLCEAVEAVNMSVPMFSFSSQTHRVESVAELLNLGGCTFFGQAFQHIKRQGYSSAVFITDGECHDSEAALREAKGLHLDIVYVGPEPMPAILRRLSEVSYQGTLQIGDLKKPVELGSRLAGLLASPT